MAPSQVQSTKLACRAEAHAPDSRLSPLKGFGAAAFTSPRERRLVGPGRLELPTSRLSGVRSNQLSYGPPEAPDLRDRTPERKPEQSRAPTLEPEGARDRTAGLQHPSGGGRRQGERETKTAASRVVLQSTRSTRNWCRYLMRGLKRPGPKTGLFGKAHP